MKKALVGLGILWFLLILVVVTLLFAEGQKKAGCHKLAALESPKNPNGIDSQKSYALLYPVR